MCRLGVFAVILFFLFLPFAENAFARQAEAEAQLLSTAEEIAEDLSTIPCYHNLRRDAVEALFRKMRAEDADITIQKVAGAENVIVTRPGKTSERIVVGAHYDFVDLGCGAVDNWTGIVALAHMYRTVARFPTEKTIVFVGFGNEEKGLLGSKGMVAAIAQDRLPQYCAMINLDSFGLAMPSALSNISSDSMVTLAQQIAGVLKMPLEKIMVLAANSDSTSFMSRRIPAITLSGISADWMSILHSVKDQAATVKPASVYLGYRLALSMLVHLDDSPCQAYQENGPSPQ